MTRSFLRLESLEDRLTPATKTLAPIILPPAANSVQTARVVVAPLVQNNSLSLSVRLPAGSVSTTGGGFGSMIGITLGGGGGSGGTSGTGTGGTSGDPVGP